MIIAKMRAFVSKFCPGICIFQFINNLWLQYTSQAYQMNCVKSLAIEKCTRNEAVLPRAALLHQSNGNEKKKGKYLVPGQAHEPGCVRSAHPDLEPIIFPSGSPIQTISR